MVDPATIPNAEQHHHQYHERRPPQTVYGAGLHELLATGTTMLQRGADTTDSKQREVNMSALFVCGLGRDLPSSSAPLATGWRRQYLSFLDFLQSGKPPL